MIKKVVDLKFRVVEEIFKKCIFESVGLSGVDGGSVSLDRMGSRG